MNKTEDEEMTDEQLSDEEIVNLSEGIADRRSFFQALIRV